MSVLLIFALLQICLTTGHGRNQCGWKNCHQRNESIPLAVHIIPHSHMSDSFTESRDFVFEKYIKKIYNNVLQSLTNNHDRTFVVSDVGLFAKWFESLSWEAKIDVYGAISREQITFVSGFWSTPDESITHYTSLMDSLTSGNRWLKKNFRDCGIPTIGWQLNAFGHSRVFAQILIQAGFDGLFFSRIDQKQKEVMKKDHSLIFNWNENPENNINNSTQSNSFLTVVTPGLYSSPQAFSFESHWYPISLEELQGGATKLFVSYVKELSSTYGTDEVFVLMGGDFSFRNSEIHFKSIDALIDTIRNESSFGVDIFYSNPNCYIKAIQAKQWPILHGDFLPVTDSDDGAQVFTGYYSTNPGLKYQIRQFESLMFATSQLWSLRLMSKMGSTSTSVEHLKRRVALLQTSSTIGAVASHSVTSKNEVLIERNMKKSLGVVSNVFMDFLELIADGGGKEISVCPIPFLQTCRLGAELLEDMIAYVYNPSIHKQVEFVRLSVPSKVDYAVSNWQGYDISSQSLTPTFNYHDIDAQLNQTVSDEQYLYFKTILPPLGVTSFRIRKAVTSAMKVSSIGDENFIFNSKFKVAFNRATGSLESILITKTSQLISLKQKFIMYKPSIKSNHLVFDPEGAAVELSENSKLINVTRGPIVQEISQVVNNFINQTIRLYQSKNNLEFEYFIGPLPESLTGMELLTRFESDLSSSSFFTDSNCRGFVEKTTRSGFTQLRNQFTSGNVGVSNFYPVTCYITIKDTAKNIQMNVFTDQPMAGTSSSSGAIEMLIQRKIPFKSGIVNEEVDYKNPVLVKNWLSFENDLKEVNRFSKRLLWSPIVFFDHGSDSSDMVEYSFANGTINQNLHLLAVDILALVTSSSENSGEELFENKLIFRIENISWNETITQDTEFLFKNVQVTNVVRMNLAANVEYEEMMKRGLRNVKLMSASSNSIKTSEARSKSNPRIVTIKPNQIETYILSFIRIQ